MPERRTHQKSRLGCQQCKNRRVKCDEQYPTCGACQRRGDPCSYTHVSHPGESAHSPRSISLGESTTRRELHIRELELMHQWSTQTSFTFAWSAEDDRIQQIDVSRLAISHDFLLDAVFAVTALHLAVLRPEEAREFVDSAVRYQTRALTACRSKLVSMGVSECAAMFHCSVLLGLVALALQAADSEHGEAIAPTQTLIQLSQLWRGTEYILKASKEFVDSSTYQTLFPVPTFPESVDIPPTSPAHGFLEDMRSLPNVIERQEVFFPTIDRLQHLYRVCQASSSIEVPSRFAWLVHTPAGFLDYLADSDPAACAITMLYAVLLLATEIRWWTKGISKQLMDELTPLLLEAGSDYERIVQWATEQLRANEAEEMKLEL